MSNKLFRLILISVLLIAGSARLAIAQESPLKEFDEAMKAGLRLKAIESAKQSLIEHPEFASVLPQLLPVVSDYSIEYPLESVTVAKVRNKDYVRDVQTKIEDGTIEYREAIEAIVELAEDRRIVILNEAHDSPQHRSFGLQLTKAMYDAGFTYLAMETLSRRQGGSGICNIDYPTMETGYYSSEPVFGDFIRFSNNLGYKLVAYEIEPHQQSGGSGQYDSILEREHAQSDNLIKHVLSADENSRVFIYVGYDHATEDWRTLDDGRELGWMAAQIQRKTGIDPLTIDQVGGSYNPRAESIDPIFDLVSKTGHINRSVIAQLPDGANLTSDRYYGKVDLTVFHPAQKMIDGRPDWLRMNGYRVAHVIENKDYFAEAPTLLQAFFASETPNGLPVDQVLLDSAEGSSTLLLPQGTYRLRSQTRERLMDNETTLEITQSKTPD